MHTHPSAAEQADDWLLAREGFREGQTQTEFAAAIGVEQTTISRWERGESLPSVVALVRIASLVGKPLEFFVDFHPTEGGNSTIVGAGDTAFAVDISDAAVVWRQASVLLRDALNPTSFESWFGDGAGSCRGCLRSTRSQ